jgi:predicted dienelactone hydrolase
MTFLKCCLLLAVAGGCGDIADSASVPDAADDGALPDADLPLPDADADAAILEQGCPAVPARCLYTPPRLPIELVEVAVTDPDRVGGPRPLNVAIRFSRMAPQPMPVVVWSHGGASGQTNAVGALEEWAIAAAEAGYLSVAIAHTPRDQAQRDALCASLGFDAAGCATFKFLSYDRPLDISLVIDRLVAISTQVGLPVQFDVARLAVGGHSAGAGGALMVAGAAREVNQRSLVMSDPRPIAFLAFSPQAPGSDGMTEAGYGLIARPTLIGTGRGDHDPPDTADGRASVFDLMQPGNKARIFVEDPAAIHTVFALETENCARNASLQHCEQMRDWVKSAGLAFLDAHVRMRPAAIMWIGSNRLALASGGVAEWSTR